MIRKRNGKFLALTSDGSRVLGTHPTKDAAVQQMRAHIKPGKSVLERQGSYARSVADRSFLAGR